MSLTIYCPRHHVNHNLTGRDVEDLIHGLAAQWADEATDPTGVYNDEAGWELAAQFCPEDDLSSLRDGECYGEHMESMRESRLHFRASS